MKLIKPSFSIIDQKPGLDGIYKQIEKAGRTCYKSEDLITEDSAKKFVDMLIERGHTSVLEHGSIYLLVPFDTHVHKYRMNEYSKVIDIAKNEMGDRSAVTTNLRVLVENNWLDDLKYLCEPTEYHEKRVSVRFILPVGISREFCRHRSMSFSEQSTRYCNFSKNKFDSEITCILPSGFGAPDGHIEIDTELIERVYGKEEAEAQKNLPIFKIIQSYINAEQAYMDLIKQGYPPQIARDVLPIGLKSELVMTGTISQWKAFFKLRCSEAAHPQARELAVPLKQEFINLGYLNE